MKGATIPLRDAIAYLLWKHGCIHPYRISRILVLANWKAEEKLGKPITKFSIEGLEAGFVIPEVGEIKEKVKKCFEYTCSEPVNIPREYAEIIDQVYEETKNLDDISLNRLVIRDPRYKELLERGGFQ